MRQILLTKNFPQGRSWALQAIAWLLFICYEQSAIFFTIGALHGIPINAAYYGINIAAFYAHYYLLQTLIVKKGRGFLTAAACTVPELLLVVVIKYGANLLFTAGHRLSAAETLQTGWWDLHRTLFFTGMATLAWAGGYIGSLGKREVEARASQLQTERDRARLETRLAVAQHAYYQQQLNPHLLLNALSFIYSRVHEHSPEAARCVLLLADLLRFCLAGGDETGLVLLADELAQVANLIQINRLRFGRKCYLNDTIGPLPAGARIIPLVLLTLTENIFKHGLVGDAERPARLDIHSTAAGQLSFSSFNYKKRPDEPGQTAQLGLRNIAIRLEEAYPGRYRLDVRDEPDTYQLTLNLPI